MNNTTVNSYNNLASEYEQETRTFWERFPRDILDNFIALVPGKKILDVGSGPGRDGLIFKDAGFDVMCLDASKEMFKLCRKAGLAAMRGSFDELPFRNESYDGAWAYTSLLHTPKSEIHKPLGEINRVLRVGGILGLGMIEGDKEGMRESAGEHRPRWFSYYSEGELGELLVKNGFEIIFTDRFTPKDKDYLNVIARKN